MLRSWLVEKVVRHDAYAILPRPAPFLVQAAGVTPARPGSEEKVCLRPAEWEPPEGCGTPPETPGVGLCCVFTGLGREAFPREGKRVL